MTDTETKVKDLLDSTQERRFTFDFSFWSHDGFGTKEDGYTYPLEGSNYKD